MNILVLGGTGAMGEHLIHHLEGGDSQVMVTSRRSHLPKKNIIYVQGNAHDLYFVKSLLTNNFDVIVDFMVYDTEEFKDRYKLFLLSCKQYVFLSSSRVYADSPFPIKESSARLLDVCKDTNYLLTDEYALIKARQENILRESGYRNWTIIRPYITFSEIRLQLGVLEKETWLYRAIHDRTIVFSKDIAEHYTTLTYGKNVSEGIVSILGNTAACGEAFHITVNESHRWQELLNIYLEEIEVCTGRRPKVLLLDKSPNLRMPKAQYQVMYDRCYNRCFNNEKIGKFIDINQFLSAEEGLRKCIRIFLNNPKFLYINWKEEAFMDKKTGEVASSSEFSSVKQAIKYYIWRFIFPVSKL